MSHACLRILLSGQEDITSRGSGFLNVIKVLDCGIIDHNLLRLIASYNILHIYTFSCRSDAISWTWYSEDRLLFLLILIAPGRFLRMCLCVWCLLVRLMLEIVSGMFGISTIHAKKILNVFWLEVCVGLSSIRSSHHQSAFCCYSC